MSEFIGHPFFSAWIGPRSMPWADAPVVSVKLGSSQNFCENVREGPLRILVAIPGQLATGFRNTKALDFSYTSRLLRK
jgi:hypothetical protein